MPRISPDGRWVAYVSTETGRPEIYVRDFTGSADAATATSGGKWIVSKDGGYWPMWRNDGKELRFIKNADETTVMAVGIETSPSFRAGVPRAVFSLPPGRARPTISDFTNVAYTSDLKRFLVPLPVDQPVPPVFNAMVNWSDAPQRGR